MKIGVVGIEKKWSTEILVDELKSLGCESFVIEMQDVVLDFSSRKVFCKGVDLSSLDAIIIKKLGQQYNPQLIDRLETLDYLSEAYDIPIFSSPKSLFFLLDRYSCTKRLALNGINIPDTVITESLEEACSAITKFGEAVIKPLYTSKSRGMILVSSKEKDLENTLKEYKSEFGIFYIQKRIHHPGYDLGVCFLGGEYLGTYARVGNKDGWNTTTARGGCYDLIEPTSEIIDLAYKSQKVFSLDFTCVDIVEQKDSKPYVFEVSAFGGFKGLKEAAGINLAEKYAKYVVSKVKK